MNQLQMHHHQSIERQNDQLKRSLVLSFSNEPAPVLVVSICIWLTDQNKVIPWLQVNQSYRGERPLNIRLTTYQNNTSLQVYHQSYILSGLDPHQVALSNGLPHLLICLKYYSQIWLVIKA